MPPRKRQSVSQRGAAARKQKVVRAAESALQRAERLELNRLRIQSTRNEELEEQRNTRL